MDAVRHPTTWRLYLAVAISCLGSVSMGAAVAYTSSALPSMKRVVRFQLTEDEESWISSLLTIGAALGSLIGGALIDRLGKKRMVHVSCIPMICGWVAIVAAQNVYMIYVGRILTGFASGAMCQVSVYITEIAPHQVRGMLGGCFGFFVTVGFTLSYGVGIGLDWIWSAAILMVPPSVMAVLMFLIPESPSWLLQKDRREEASNALTWLRGSKGNVNAEMEEITKGIENNRSSGGSKVSCTDVFKPESFKPLTVSLVIFSLQQTCGICAIMFYTADIFRSAGSTLDPAISALITGIVQCLGNVAAMSVVERLGRKILLQISGGFMAVSLGVLGYYFKMTEDDASVASDFGWLPLLCLIVYAFIYNVGYGPLPWVLLGEINTTDAKTIASSIASAFVWSMAFLITKSFVFLLNSLTPPGTYWLFTGCCFFGLFYVQIFVPETKGKSTQEIQDYFSKSKKEEKDFQKVVIIDDLDSVGPPLLK